MRRLGAHGQESKEPERRSKERWPKEVPVRKLGSAALTRLGELAKLAV
jgi:hypothetical protein